MSASAFGHAARSLEFDSGRQDLQFVQAQSSTYTVPAYVRLVEALTTASGSAFTITLSRPEECPGQTVKVYMTARNSTKDITVSGIGFSNITLDAADEYTLLHSDGKRWSEIGSNHA